MAADYRVIQDGGMLTKKVSEERVVQFDWDTVGLPTGVQLATPTFSVVTIDPSTESSPALTKDNEGLVSGNRKTQLRIKVGTAGSKYRVRCQAVTNESPTQTLVGDFFVVVEA